MALFCSDAHKERARLCFGSKDLAGAREHFAVAKGLVAKRGYQRRAVEVAVLAEVLGEGQK